MKFAVKLFVYQTAQAVLSCNRHSSLFGGNKACQHSEHAHFVCMPCSQAVDTVTTMWKDMRGQSGCSLLALQTKQTQWCKARN